MFTAFADNEIPIRCDEREIHAEYAGKLWNRLLREVGSLGIVVAHRVSDVEVGHDLGKVVSRTESQPQDGNLFPIDHLPKAGIELQQLIHLRIERQMGFATLVTLLPILDKS